VLSQKVELVQDGARRSHVQQGIPMLTPPAIGAICGQRAH